MKRFAWVIPAVLVLTACRTVPRVADSTTAYHAAVTAFAGRPNVVPGSDAERQGIEGLKSLLGDFSADNVRARTRQVYAPDAFFNDTLKTVYGADKIEAYFLATAQNSESVTAKFEDVTRANDGTYYFRWIMDTRLKKVARGETIRTLGITHVRFDEQGRVLIHQDYWDTAVGLWDHVPVVGTMVRSIKARF